MDKGLIDFIKNQEADLYFFQETRTSEERANKKLLEVPNYKDYWNSAEKKGYSGVVAFLKKEPISTEKGIGIESLENEGRVQTLEYEDFYILNVYFINAGRDLDRLDDKKWFNNEFLLYCENLREEKPLIIGGDFNVAHKEKDLANPDQNERNAGFTMEEREWFSQFLEKGYIDTFREFEEEGEKYTYWTYRYNAREKNIGWRLDYWVISEELKEKLKDSHRLEDVEGSDHCPIVLEMDLNL